MVFWFAYLWFEVIDSGSCKTQVKRCDIFAIQCNFLRFRFRILLKTLLFRLIDQTIYVQIWSFYVQFGSVYVQIRRIDVQFWSVLNGAPKNVWERCPLWEGHRVMSCSKLFHSCIQNSMSVVGQRRK